MDYFSALFLKCVLTSALPRGPASCSGTWRTWWGRRGPRRATSRGSAMCTCGSWPGRTRRRRLPLAAALSGCRPSHSRMRSSCTPVDINTHCRTCVRISFYSRLGRGLKCKTVFHMRMPGDAGLYFSVIAILLARFPNETHALKFHSLCWIPQSWLATWSNRAEQRVSGNCPAALCYAPGVSKLSTRAHINSDNRTMLQGWVFAYS